jgi:hypothetical protein
MPKRLFLGVIFMVLGLSLFTSCAAVSAVSNAANKLQGNKLNLGVGWI